MRYLVISDTHFGHSALTEKCARPSDFDRKILKHVQQDCNPNDVIIHLGDFCFGDSEYWTAEFMRVCPNTRWLVRGNHDSCSYSWYHDHGWNFVGESLQLDVFGEKILFTHMPVEVPTGMLNVHGHLHNTGHRPSVLTDDRHLLIQIESTLAPVLLKTLIDDWRQRKKRIDGSKAF